MTDNRTGPRATFMRVILAEGIINHRLFESMLISGWVYIYRLWSSMQIPFFALFVQTVCDWWPLRMRCIQRLSIGKNLEPISRDERLLRIGRLTQRVYGQLSQILLAGRWVYFARRVISDALDRKARNFDDRNALLLFGRSAQSLRASFKAHQVIKVSAACARVCVCVYWG